MHKKNTSKDCDNRDNNNNNNNNGLLTVYPHSGSSPVKNYNIKRNNISDYKMILYINVIEISNTHYLQMLFSK